MFWLTICDPLSMRLGNTVGAYFQSRFDKSTAQAIEMKKGALRVLLIVARWRDDF